MGDALAKWHITGSFTPKDDGSFDVDLTAEAVSATRARPAPTVGAATDEDLEAERVRLAGQLGSSLDALARGMVDLMAAENKSGKVSLRRVVREVYQPFTRAVQNLGPEAMSFGMEQAISRGVPNINYAKKAAKSYGTEATGVAPTSSMTRYDILGRGDDE